MIEPQVPDRAKQLAQVAGLATSVADRILDAQIRGGAIPQEQLTSLVSAARLMQDHGVGWPPLVEQVLYEFAERLEHVDGQDEPAEPVAGDDVATGLTRFFRASGGRREWRLGRSCPAERLPQVSQPAWQPGAAMTDQPSHEQNRKETKAAKAGEKQENAAAVWAKVEAERKAVDERTERLRAARLARDAQN